MIATAPRVPYLFTLQRDVMVRYAWYQNKIRHDVFVQGLKENFDDIVFATGSGGTGAGLVLANYLSNSRLR